MKTARILPRIGMFVAAFALLLFVPRQALAHAVLVSSTPAAHASVKGPELAVHLKFNSRIDGAHSRLYLVGPDGKVQTLTLEAQSAPDALSAQSIHLAAGQYT